MTLTSPQMTAPHDRVAFLAARMAALEKQVATLLERDQAARDAELALAEGGAV